MRDVPSSLRFRLPGLIVAVLVPACPAAAQAESVDRATIEQRMRDVEAATIGQVDKDAAKKTWQEALGELARAETATREAAEFERQAKEAPTLLAKVLAEIEAGAETADPSPAPNTPLDQLEVQAKQAEAAQRVAEQELSALTQETDRRKRRLATLPAEIEAARGALRELEASIGAPRRAGAEKPVERATRDLALAKRDATRSELARLEAELRCYTARSGLLRKRRELAGLHVIATSNLAKAWTRLVAEERRQRARAAEDQEQLLAAQVARYPAVRAYQAESQRLGERNRALLAEQERAEKELRECKDERARLRKSFLAIRPRLRSGLTDAVGLLLRQALLKLDDPDVLRHQARRRHQRIAELDYDRIVREGEQEGLSNPAAVDVEAARLLAGVRDPTQPVRAIIREVVQAKKENLDALVTAYGRLTSTLLDLDAQSGTLIQAIETFQSYIREHVLWARSVAKGKLPDPDQTMEAVRWVAQPRAWSELLLDSLQLEAPYVILFTVWLLAIVLLLVTARRIRRSLRSLADLVAKERTDRFSLTVRALLHTVLLAAPIPLTLLLLHVLLRVGARPTEFSLAAREAFRATAWFLLPLWLLRHGLTPRGLCAKHFRWPIAATKALRKHLRWYVPVAAAALFVATMLDRQRNVQWHESLGRISFLIGVVALAVFLTIVLRPKGAVLGELLTKYRSSWLHGSRLIWYPFLAGAPLVLAVLALLGYFYTATHIESLLHRTIWFLLGLVALHALLLRWWFVKRRRLAVQQANVQAKEPERADRALSSSEAPAAEESGFLDLPGLHHQARQLFRAAIAVSIVVGLYGIWAEALPALRILERVQIWPTVRVLEVSERASLPRLLDTAPAPERKGEAPPPDSASADDRAVVQSPARGPIPVVPAPDKGGEAAETIVSLADLGLAVILLLITMSLARHLPALLEITLLKSVRTDTGGRYAITTLLRYAVAVAGIVMAFSALGIGWTHLQWLIAALTFGLAFGLQEIFANFISGLIILFERPVRIGDLVTVGGVHGFVSKIRMRATTITDWDRKELLVPNKEFITGQLVNWTLSDPITRIKVPVGIAYGSDTALARDILLEIAHTCCHVLEQPRPKAIFHRFGESSLDFELRVFIDDMDQWPSLMNELHDRIHKEFRQAGIEIAFPQRDLHVRSAEPLVELIDRQRALKEA